MSNLAFDLDGVLITYQKNFAESYSEEFGIDIEKIYEFFSNDYYDCAVGRSALPEKIEKYISPWKWPGDADALIKYWFDRQSTIDERLIALIRSARSAGNKCYAASDQDAMRSAYIRNLLDIDSIFDGCFFSCELGATKADLKFFERILDSLQCAPAEINFWDDNPKNIATAKKSGINAEVYTSYDDFQTSFCQRFCAS